MTADRNLAVADHAVERFASRACVGYLPTVRLREFLRQAALEGIRGGRSMPHRDGQERVLVTVLGVSVWAIIGRDTTGWGRGGRAVVMCLTPEQVEGERR